jgi:membrane protein YqaA with SNARE-associated domain
MTGSAESVAGDRGSELAAIVVEEASARTRSRLRTVVFALENALVVVLAAWWLLWGRHGQANGLLILFFYCFPSEFLIAPLPHEPILLYFGKVYPAFTVAAVSVAGTVLVEALNYHAFGFVADARPLRRVVHSRWIARAVALFQRWPFLTLCFFSLAPVPFYPFRFLVVLARYPLPRYLVAIFVSRAPRFYLLALLGSAVRLPDRLFAAVCVVFLAFSVGSLLPMSIRRRQRSAPEQATSAGPTNAPAVALPLPDDGRGRPSGWTMEQTKPSGSQPGSPTLH